MLGSLMVMLHVLLLLLLLTMVLVRRTITRLMQESLRSRLVVVPRGNRRHGTALRGTVPSLLLRVAHY